MDNKVEQIKAMQEAFESGDSQIVAQKVVENYFPIDHAYRFTIEVVK
ncbi:hypothetical protein P4597_24500 [Peribacillus simplex]|nr:hypothetical protein [Peribacillus simplex]